MSICEHFFTSGLRTRDYFVSFEKFYRKWKICPVLRSLIFICRWFILSTHIHKSVSSTTWKSNDFLRSTFSRWSLKTVHEPTPPSSGSKAELHVGYKAITSFLWHSSQQIKFLTFKSLFSSKNKLFNIIKKPQHKTELSIFIRLIKKKKHNTITKACHTLCFFFVSLRSIYK